MPAAIDVSARAQAALKRALIAVQVASNRWKDWTDALGGSSYTATALNGNEPTNAQFQDALTVSGGMHALLNTGNSAAKKAILKAIYQPIGTETAVAIVDESRTALAEEQTALRELREIRDAIVREATGADKGLAWLTAGLVASGMSAGNAAAMAASLIAGLDVLTTLDGELAAQTNKGHKALHKAAK